MRIQSKFKDYYDFCAAYGVDTTVFYKREEEKIPGFVRYGKNINQMRPNPHLSALFDLIPEYSKSMYGRYNGNFGESVISYSYKYVPGFEDDTVTHLGYLIIGSLVVPYLYEFHYDTKDEKKSYGRYHYDYYAVLRDYAGKYGFYTKKRFKDHFSRKFDAMKLVKALNAPVIAIRYDKVVLNPKLIPYKVQDVVDGVKAFSEIEQTLGILNTKEDLIEIADTDKLGQKGFDDYSFKKRKAK